MSFSVDAGEVFGYLGPNGAGKTTTLRIIRGLFHATASRVGMAGFLIALLSYLARVIPEMWPKAACLRPSAPNSSYDPRVILKTGAIPLRSAAVLAGIAVRAWLSPSGVSRKGTSLSPD